MYLIFPLDYELTINPASRTTLSSCNIPWTSQLFGYVTNYSL